MDKEEKARRLRSIAFRMEQNLSRWVLCQSFVRMNMESKDTDLILLWSEKMNCLSRENDRLSREANKFT